MKATAKGLRIVTLANALVAILLAIVLYAILQVISIAAGISITELTVLLALGPPLAILGLVLAVKLGPHRWRWLSFVINGVTFAFYAAILIGIGILFYGATHRRFVIPEGDVGEVYVVYGPQAVADADPTFRIPKDGILFRNDSRHRGGTRDEYFYERDDGTRYAIQHRWNTTVPRTAENLANTRDIGIFFPRSGTIYNSSNCKVEYDLFYVGTRARLLSGYKRIDTGQIFRERCGSE